MILILYSNTIVQRKTNSSEIIGFGCYSSGMKTPLVHKVSVYISKCNYSKIAKLLNSKSPAEKFLAVMSLEQLSELNEYVLTKTDKQLISNAYLSVELISVCSGCSYFDEIELKDLLIDTNKNEIIEEGKQWLKNLIIYGF